MIWILIICVLYSTVHIYVRAKFFFARTDLFICKYVVHIQDIPKVGLGQLEVGEICTGLYTG